MVQMRDQILLIWRPWEDSFPVDGTLQSKQKKDFDSPFFTNLLESPQTDKVELDSSSEIF